MGIAASFARWRHRGAWADPVRKLRTLESFAETEEDGGRDLEVAARRVADADLRSHLLRHADDEKRHAALFRKHAAELRAELALSARDAAEPDAAYDLSRGRKGHEVDAHGFFRAGLCDELGEVAYVAMVNVAERRAASVFEVHRDLNMNDAGLRATFEDILRDEKYHVAYTERFLERWTAAGLGDEVEKGLGSARTSRFLGAWKRLGLRSGAGFSQMLLFVSYCTLLAPFGLLARFGKPAPAARELPAVKADRSLRGQA